MTVTACHFLRNALGSAGPQNDDRKTLAARAGAFRCADGRTLHLRNPIALEPHQQLIYDILPIHPDVGGFVI